MRQLQAKISLREFLGQIDGRPAGIDCAGVSGSERAYLVAEIYRRRPTPMLVVTATPKEAERFQSDLRFFDPAHAAAVKEFPPYNILPFKFIAYHNETAARRIRTLYELLDPAAAPIVVTTVGALVQKIVPRATLVDFAELIQVGEEFDRDALLARLSAGGYSRSVVVEEPGDYSVRGGIIDIFSPLYDDPVRIEMFGDLVESPRFFSAVSQRTIGTADEIVVLPAKEAVLHPSAVAEVVSRVRTRAAALEMRVTDIRKLVGRLKQEGSFAGIESLLPLIDTPLETLLDFLPADTLPVLDDPGALAQAAAKAEALTDAN